MSSISKGDFVPFKFNYNDQVIINMQEEDLAVLELSATVKTSIKLKQPFFIVNLNRNCRGSPLYGLSLIPIQEHNVNENNLQLSLMLELELPPCSELDDYFELLNLSSHFCINNINQKNLISYLT